MDHGDETLNNLLKPWGPVDQCNDLKGKHMFVDLKLLFVDPKPIGSMYDIYIYLPTWINGWYCW